MLVKTEDEEEPQTNLLRTSQNQYFTSHSTPETPMKKGRTAGFCYFGKYGRKGNRSVIDITIFNPGP